MTDEVILVRIETPIRERIEKLARKWTELYGWDQDDIPTLETMVEVLAMEKLVEYEEGAAK